MALSDVTFRNGVNPYAIVQGTFTLLAAQTIGEVIRGGTLAAEPKTEMEALRVKITYALVVVIIIILILYFFYHNQQLSGVTYRSLNVPVQVPAVPSVRKMMTSSVPSIGQSSLGSVGTPSA